ncbi:MAG: SulP family inorganic anion transporter [Micromonosporaceae bacterium]
MSIASWRHGYERSWFGTDVLAGLTVTAILIPEGMAYAQLAGVGPEAAFYAAPIGLLMYAMLGSSRQLVVAVSSAVAITSAATITSLAQPGTAKYVALTAALALMAGLISVLAGLLRLGRIAQFFSSSVLLGFVFALALIITEKQIPKLLGIHADVSHFFTGVWNILTHLGTTSVVTLTLGAVCMAAMIVFGRFVPKLPAALFVLIGSIIASAALDLPSHGVAVVGKLPSGLAPPKLPHVGWEAVPMLLTGAAGIALLAFAEAMGPARQFAKQHGYEVDANRELVAIGAANLGAGLFQGFPIGASLSKSAANDRVGAKSPMSLIVAAAATALVALFFTPLFTDLPEAALGAIVIVAVAEMERVKPLVRLWRLHRPDFVLAMIALLAVLIFNILPGLAIAIVASLGVVIWRAAEARLELLGQTPSGLEVVPLTEESPLPGLLVIRPEQMIFFVNANEVRDAVATAVTSSDPRPDVVLLDLRLTPDLDVPSADALAGLNERLRAMGVQFWMSDLMPSVRNRLRIAGLIDQIGPEHVFNEVAGGLFAYLNAHSAPGGDARGEVLADLLEALRTRRRHPGLDEQARKTIDAIADRLEVELRNSESDHGRS